MLWRTFDCRKIILRRLVIKKYCRRRERQKNYFWNSKRLY